MCSKLTLQIVRDAKLLALQFCLLSYIVSLLSMGISAKGKGWFIFLT